jgi:release factor glutamine methyltransferase
VSLVSSHSATAQPIAGQELWQWRQAAQKQAIAAGLDPAELDWLLLELTELDRLSLRLDRFQAQPAVQSQVAFSRLQQLWQQRINQRLPLQYLVGRTHWRDFTLRVSPSVLIPRPETELLVDLAIAASRDRPQLATGMWADLGTGSGAIAIGLARELPDARVHAVDTSVEALELARSNAKQLAVEDRIRFYAGHWLEPLAHLRGQLSGLVANPPYIPSAEIDHLQPEVAWHEPRLALDGGEDGLDCLQLLVEQGAEYLRSGGVWIVELMLGQAQAVADRLAQQGTYEQIRIVPDLAGIDRVVMALRQ